MRDWTCGLVIWQARALLRLAARLTLSGNLTRALDIDARIAGLLLTRGHSWHRGHGRKSGVKFWLDTCALHHQSPSRGVLKRPFFRLTPP
jgi:hypothetical protein